MCATTVITILVIIAVLWLAWRFYLGWRARTPSSMTTSDEVGGVYRSSPPLSMQTVLQRDPLAVENIRYQTEGLNWQVRYPFEYTWLRPYYFRWGHAPYYPSRDVLVDKTIV